MRAHLTMLQSETDDFCLKFIQMRSFTAIQSNYIRYKALGIVVQG